MAKYREVGLDVQATMHMREAMEKNQPWLCNCMACQYMLRSPQVVMAVKKALEKELKKVIV